MEDQGVQTCDFYRTDQDLPHRFNNPECFQGYSQKKIHPLYRTSNQVYGSKKPTVHEMQTQFKGKSCQFTKEMLRGGMYRDHGFNTTLDRRTGEATFSNATQKNRVDRQYYHHYLNQSHEHSGNNK